MFDVTRLAATTLAAASLIAGSSASAAVYVVTYSGIVSGSYDKSGLFGGTAGGNLDGDSFVATVTYDTGVGTRVSVPGVSDEVYGGTNYGVGSPVSATLEINHITQSFGGGFAGSAFTQPGYIGATVEDNASPVTGETIDNTMLINGFTAAATASLDTTFLSTATTPYPPTFFYVANFAFDTLLNGDHLVDTSGYLDATTVQVSGPAPEPGTWALMLAGIAILGGGLRQRRRSARRIARAVSNA